MPTSNELRISNSRFALEQAVKLRSAQKDRETSIIDDAGVFRDFLNESVVDAVEFPTGFQPGP